MTACRLCDARRADRLLHLALQHGFVQVRPAALAGLAIEVGAGGREDPLPTPLPTGLGILAAECEGQLDPACASDAILLVARTNTVDVASKFLLGYRGKQRHPVLLTNYDLVQSEVGALDAQTG